MNTTYTIDWTDKIIEAKEKKTLNKPFRTPKGPKKFSVYVKNEKGNVVKVNFGDPNMEIKRDDPARRKSFRARHNCDNPGPKTKARYWSCKQWRAGKKVQGSTEYEWDGATIFDHDELLDINPALAFVEEEVNDDESCCGCENCDNSCNCDCDCKEASAAATPNEYIFNNPGEAAKKAKEMGLDGIHSHKDGEKTVFMPGPSHEALMKKIGDSEASLWKNIKKKKDRIKSGSGEKMRKKGEKGAPTSEQMERAKNKSKKKKMKSGYAYEMTLEEYNEVIDPLGDIIKNSFLEELEAARPGPKSGAQTPAKPSEKKKGSSKNKPGSAGKGGSSITFSEKVLTSLKNKVKEHNSKSKKKVTLSQLKKVYRRGAGAFSQSHRPGMTRGGWAMARVNMFLKMKRGGKVKDSYRKADSDV